MIELLISFSFAGEMTDVKKKDDFKMKEKDSFIKKEDPMMRDTVKNEREQEGGFIQTKPSRIPLSQIILIIVTVGVLLLFGLLM